MFLFSGRAIQLSSSFKILGKADTKVSPLEANLPCCCQWERLVKAWMKFLEKILRVMRSVKKKKSNKSPGWKIFNIQTMIKHQKDPLKQNLWMLGFCHIFNSKIKNLKIVLVKCLGYLRSKLFFIFLIHGRNWKSFGILHKKHIIHYNFMSIHFSSF